MGLPELIKNKINRSIQIVGELRKLHEEISSWLEANGIETGNDEFITEVWDAFSHGEIDSADEFEEMLNRYIKDLKRLDKEIRK